MKNKGKIQSLKKSSDFKQLFAIGKRRTISSWLFVTYKKTQENGVRFGVTISRKVGNAVIRNKLKRWCRSLMRDLTKEMNEDGIFFSIDINFVFKTVSNDFFKKMEFKEFRDLAEPILRQIGKRN